jgi:hypothetical protein
MHGDQTPKWSPNRSLALRHSHGFLGGRQRGLKCCGVWLRSYTPLRLRYV